jgi:TolB-like protein/Flp pilus assembly protein TadD
MNFLENLKQRKLVQWAVAYLAGAWLIMQLVDVLGGRWGISDSAARIIDLALVVGFFIALVLAWYHGEQGRQRISGVELLIITGLCGIAGLLVSLLNLGDEASNIADTEITTPARIDAASSIAVLPFTIRSDDRQDEYFAAGIHDDLLTRLARIEGLKVISRTSVMQYADTTKPMRQIAEELRVATVLEGAVQRGGDRIRVTAQLIDAGNDKHLWAEIYDEELTVANVFQIQSSLASEIARALDARLLPGVQERIDYQPTENLVAWDLASRAAYLLDKGRLREDLQSAEALFRQSIKEDPGYAPAWAGLSQAILELVQWHYEGEEELPPAMRAAERAIQLDPDHGEGYFALGNFYRMQRRFDESERAMQKGLGLSPGSAGGHSNYAAMLRDSGQLEKSVREARISVELDPRVMRTREVLLQNLYFNHQWEALLKEADEMLQLDPDSAYTLYWTGLAQTWLGNTEAGLAASKKAVELGGNAPYLVSGLAYNYAMAGEAELASYMLMTAEEDGWPLVEIGLVYAWLPDLDIAFNYMERAMEERPSALMYLNTDPGADPMRKDPRWKRLQQRLEQPAESR